jgi:hypothetical protein
MEQLTQCLAAVCVLGVKGGPRAARMALGVWTSKFGRAHAEVCVATERRIPASRRTRGAPTPLACAGLSPGARGILFCRSRRVAVAEKSRQDHLHQSSNRRGALGSAVDRSSGLWGDSSYVEVACGDSLSTFGLPPPRINSSPQALNSGPYLS